MNVELSKLKDMISDGKIFSCTFVKRTDGSVRRMVARTGVTKDLSGGDRSWDPESRGLVTVYDMQNKGYRMIPVDSIQEIRVRKKTLRFD